MRGALLFILSFKIFAYSFTIDMERGYYWRSFPINMQKIVVDASRGPLLNQLVNTAVSEWEEAIGSDVWDVGEDFIVSTNFSGNYIRWSFNFSEETGFDSQTTLAVATRYSTGTYMVRTDIILNGQNPTLTNNWDNALYTTILHEFGHTLGLDHSDEPAVMQPSLGSISRLTWDDEQGAIAAYETHRERRRTNFISPFSRSQESEESNRAIGCGTVSNIDRTPPTKGLGAFILVFFMVAFFLTREEKVFHEIRSY